MKKIWSSESINAFKKAIWNDFQNNFLQEQMDYIVPNYVFIIWSHNILRLQVLKICIDFSHHAEVLLLWENIDYLRFAKIFLNIMLIFCMNHYLKIKKMNYCIIITDFRIFTKRESGEVPFFLILLFPNFPHLQNSDFSLRFHWYVFSLPVLSRF